MTEKKPPLPRLNSDEEAEKFVAEADLSQYDLSGFKPMHFEFIGQGAKKDKKESL